MRNKNTKRWCLAIVLTLGLLCGCTKEEKNIEKPEKEPVKIPVVFRIDPGTNLSNNQEFVEEFNQMYEGEYYAEVEWLTESAAGYRERLKQWNVLDEMPAVITDAGFDYDFYRLLAENHRLVDIRPFLEQDEQWKNTFHEEIMEDCQEKDGAIYLSPLGSSVQSYAGVIYNKELLAQAGYEKFPKTWDEFWNCLEDLKELGITPLSFHGSGTYWVPMLFATAYLYGSEEGQEFLKEDFPNTYQNDSMKEMMEALAYMYQYSFEDAVDVDYDKAAARFQEGKAAIFANGYWMVEEMPDNLKEKMGFAPFPGNVLMNSPRMSAWAITAGYEREVTEGAVKLLQYRSLREEKNTEKLMERIELNSLQTDYADAVEKVENTMPNYQLKWEQEIQNSFFNQYIPDYLKGEISVENFLTEMDNQLKNIEESK